MKYNLKKLFSLVLVLALSLAISLPAFADENAKGVKDSGVKDSAAICTTSQVIQVIKTNKKADVNYHLLSGLGDILYQTSIVVNGQENPLLCTFAGPKKSMTLIKNKDKDILQILAKKYGLSEINDSNWEDYQTAIDNFSDDSDAVKMHEHNRDLLKQYYSLEAALEIYEDSYLNNEVLDFVKISNNKLKQHTITKIVLDDILGHLPTTDSLIQKSQKPLNLVHSHPVGQISPNQIVGLNNIVDANNYALKYADTYNRDDYPDFSEHGDCTNFVSQICYAGGVPMDSAWFCIEHDDHLFTWSKTWSVANEFANHWKPRWHSGITPNDPDHHYYNFSMQLYTKGGSIIGMDTSGNKIYHHLGYVTQRGNNLKTRFGKTFYDFYVTQHSSDYQSWASDNRGTAYGWIDVPEGTTLAIFS